MSMGGEGSVVGGGLGVVRVWSGVEFKGRKV